MPVFLHCVLRHIVYGAGGTLRAVGFDRDRFEVTSDPVTVLPAEPRAYHYPRISPDGTRVALDVRDREADIWIWDFAHETLRRLTCGPARDIYPAWTPDGTSGVERLDSKGDNQRPGTFFPDGRDRKIHRS